VRLLVAVLVRALGVTLLLGTVVLPAADHHAAGRLIDAAGAQPEDAHYLIVHHHPAQRAATALGAAGVAAIVSHVSTNAPSPTIPPTTVLPAAPPVDALAGGGAPIVDALALGLVLTAAASVLPGGGSLRPPSRALRVPVPPPRPALLSVA
jgi:hypothetical protein